MADKLSINLALHGECPTKETFFHREEPDFNGVNDALLFQLLEYPQPPVIFTVVAFAISKNLDLWDFLHYIFISFNFSKCVN